MVTESKSYKASFKEAYNASLEALKKCGFEVRERRGNSIKATADPSILSWGENIEVLLTPEPGGVKVKISSSPTAQLFDWGKSRDNVSQIFSNLELKLSKMTKE